VPERDYSHRAVVDKLGVKPGHVVALAQGLAAPPPDLIQQILERSGRPEADLDEPVDVAFQLVVAGVDAMAVLSEWRPRLAPAGGVWLLSPKRGQTGYVDQRELIEAGKLAGVVDNKVCSVSDTLSAMRFVIRKADRPH
jgi:hypothetical protein